MSIPLFPVENPDFQFNFDLLAQALIDTGGRSIGLRFGVQNLTFAAGAGTSDLPTVTHGLGVTPVGVLALQNAVGGPSPVVPQAQNVSATTFQLYGEFRTGTWAAGGTIPFFWVAVG